MISEDIWKGSSSFFLPETNISFARHISRMWLLCNHHLQSYAAVMRSTIQFNTAPAKFKVTRLGTLGPVIVQQRSDFAWRHFCTFLDK